MKKTEEPRPARRPHQPSFSPVLVCFIFGSSCHCFFRVFLFRLHTCFTARIFFLRIFWEPETNPSRILPPRCLQQSLGGPPGRVFDALRRLQGGGPISGRARLPALPRTGGAKPSELRGQGRGEGGERGGLWEDLL